MILPLLSLLETACVASLCVIGVGIGAFYRMKFGEGTHGWLLWAGAGLGILGQILSIIPAVPPGASDLVFVPAAVLLAVGTFWLWFVMLGPRR